MSVFSSYPYEKRMARYYTHNHFLCCSRRTDMLIFFSSFSRSSVDNDPAILSFFFVSSSSPLGYFHQKCVCVFEIEKEDG